MPLTPEAGPGSVFRIERLGGTERYAARVVSGVSIDPCAGAHTVVAARRLGRALAEGGQRFVRSLRRDAHAGKVGCWLHGDGWCLSTAAA